MLGSRMPKESLHVRPKLKGLEFVNVLSKQDIGFLRLTCNPIFCGKFRK